MAIANHENSLTDNVPYCVSNSPPVTGKNSAPMIIIIVLISDALRK